MRRIERYDGRVVFRSVRNDLCDARYCFRPATTTIYQDDAAGLPTPVLCLCRKHSGTDEPEVFVKRSTS